ncbi:DUF4937 domain-containing protein [Paenibacillus thiaminolyticus]|uniref:DUF4937 domain-containing protein n=1 Tax=Paenibacillus thiaminolyticus TaxID=49283 RepID=UPI003D29AD79
MLIKMIKCIVNEDSKAVFHHAQTKWEQLKSVSGFIAQLGGWNQIMDTNNQKKSYEKIEVSLWETDETIHVNDIQALEWLTVLDIGTDQHRVEKSNQKTVFMIQVNQEKASKLLIMQNEFDEHTEQVEAQLQLEREWAVGGNPGEQ